MNPFGKIFKSQKGSVAVEFALILPVFLMLMFSVIELGSAWYYKQMLVSATREGARAASMLNDPTNTTGQVTTLVNTYLTQAGFPGNAQVTVSGADGAAGTQVNVTTTSLYQMPVLGKLVSSSIATMTLSATTIMRHE